MNNEDELLLPTRDFLRQLIGQPFVRAGELKSILRTRGTFTSSDRKEVTGPILIKTGLSPTEYVELRETYRTKEESIKSKTSTISWDSDTYLIDSLPGEMDYSSLLNDKFGVFDVEKVTSFASIDGNPDHVYMDFEITRRDAVKNWGKNKVTHSGRIEIRKIASQRKLNIRLNYTAPETVRFGNNVSSSLIGHFKAQGHVKHTEQATKIKYNDFSNESRVQFINDLSRKVSDTILTFEDTKNIHFSPDHQVPNPPQDITWMRNKIEDLKMKGQSLHSTFFVSDQSIHKHIKLFGIQCDYTFTTDKLAGSCRILYDFSDKEESTEGELTVNVSAIKVNKNTDGISKGAITKLIIESLEKNKIEVYEKYKIDTTTIPNKIIIVE